MAPLPLAASPAIAAATSVDLHGLVTASSATAALEAEKAQLVRELERERAQREAADAKCNLMAQHYADMRSFALTVSVGGILVAALTVAIGAARRSA